MKNLLFLYHTKKKEVCSQKVHSCDLRTYSHLYIPDSLVYNTIEVMHMATNRPRYTVSVDNDLFKKIEDFRFKNRFQTRSESTVELIRLGLEALKNEDNTKENK